MKNIKKILSLAVLVPFCAQSMDKNKHGKHEEKRAGLTVDVSDSISVPALVTTTTLVDVASNPNLDRSTKNQLATASFRNMSPNSKRNFVLGALTFLSKDIQGLIQIQSETTSILNRQLLQSVSAANSKSNSPAAAPVIETQSVPAVELSTSSSFPFPYMAATAPTPTNSATTPLLNTQTLSAQSPRSVEKTVLSHLHQTKGKKSHRKKRSSSTKRSQTPVERNSQRESVYALYHEPAASSSKTSSSSEGYKSEGDQSDSSTASIIAPQSPTQSLSLLSNSSSSTSTSTSEQ